MDTDRSPEDCNPSHIPPPLYLPEQPKYTPLNQTKKGKKYEITSLDEYSESSLSYTSEAFIKISDDTATQWTRQHCSLAKQSTSKIKSCKNQENNFQNKKEHTLEIIYGPNLTSRTY